MRRERLESQNRQARFEQAMMGHLDAAYNLARWLMGNDQDAEDRVQDAYLRAYKSFDTFRGTDSRAWILMIVRNTCYTWFQQNHTGDSNAAFDEDIHTIGIEAPNCEKLLLEQVDHELIQSAVNDLPLEFREAFILRELDDLSYKEIAQITRVPLGTVMSRLARARKQLQTSLSKRMNGE